MTTHEDYMPINIMQRFLDSATKEASNFQKATDSVKNEQIAIRYKELAEHKMHGVEVYTNAINCLKQQDENNNIRKAISPLVIYRALRYYYKQGLFEPEEFKDLENAMEAISALNQID